MPENLVIISSVEDKETEERKHISFVENKETFPFRNVKWSEIFSKNDNFSRSIRLLFPMCNLLCL